MSTDVKNVVSLTLEEVEAELTQMYNEEVAKGVINSLIKK